MPVFFAGVLVSMCASVCLCVCIKRCANIKSAPIGLACAYAINCAGKGAGGRLCSIDRQLLCPMPDTDARCAILQSLSASFDLAPDLREIGAQRHIAEMTD
eukprot:6204877-Pleurochrysis_carterae.AAC.1